MILGQLLLHDASRYEQNAANIDRETMAEAMPTHFWRSVNGTTVLDEHDNELPLERLASTIQSHKCSVLHIYGETIPVAPLKNLSIPYVSANRPRQPRIGWRKAPQPAATTLPSGEQAIREAVHSRFLWADTRAIRSPLRIGTFLGSRTGIRSICEQTYQRLERFRDDLEWELFDQPPELQDFLGVDVWVDPAEEGDLDGMVLEALATLTPVVAARTSVNSVRLDGGRAGFLIPRDPNELTHAIASTLFKPELSADKAAHAKGHRLRFTPEERRTDLLTLYRRISDE